MTYVVITSYSIHYTKLYEFEGGEDVEDLMMLCRADITTANKNKLKKYLENFDNLSIKLKEVEEKDRLRNFKPPVNGEDIMIALNENGSPKVGKIKNMIVEAILNRIPAYNVCYTTLFRL